MWSLRLENRWWMAAMTQEITQSSWPMTDISEGEFLMTSMTQILHWPFPNVHSIMQRAQCHAAADSVNGDTKHTDHMINLKEWDTFQIGGVRMHFHTESWSREKEIPWENSDDSVSMHQQEAKATHGIRREMKTEEKIIEKTHAKRLGPLPW